MSSAVLHFRGMPIIVQLEQLGVAIEQLLPHLPAWGEERASLDNTLSVLDMKGNPDRLTDALEQRDARKLTLEFLQGLLLTPAWSALGLPSEPMQRLLKVSHSKGVGSKLAVINRVLADNDFAIPDVYEKTEDQNRNSYWKPGPKILEALSKIATGDKGQSDAASKGEVAATVSVENARLSDSVVAAAWRRRPPPTVAVVRRPVPVAAKPRVAGDSTSPPSTQEDEL